MKEYQLEDILKATGAKKTMEGSVKTFTRISIDSRDCLGGEMFFAVKGDRFDGNDFVAGAVSKGAVGALLSDSAKALKNLSDNADVTLLEAGDALEALQKLASFYRMRINPRVIAVTGSNGKSTTKEILYSILAQKGNVIKTPGNFNNLVGLPLSLLNIDYGCDFAVLEMGMSFKGEIEKLCEIALPSDAILTNVALSHSENFSGLQGIAQEKASLASYVEKSGGTVFCNGDDEVLVGEIEKVCTRKVYFGVGKRCSFRMFDIERDLKSISFSFEGLNKSGRVTLNIPGIHNAYNCLGAIACAISQGFTVEEVQSGVSSANALPGRLAIKTLASGIIIIDDSYNSNPYSFTRAIEFLESLECGGIKAVVMGDMLELGKYSDDSHREMGMLCAQKGIEFLFTVGENSVLAANEAVRLGMPEEKVRSFRDSYVAGRELAGILDKGDAVLVKGSRMMHLENAIKAITEKLGTERKE